MYWNLPVLESTMKNETALEIYQSYSLEHLCVYVL